MAHYAFLDNNNIVTEVIIGKEEFEDGINWEEYYGNLRGQVCKRTSYNTSLGSHKFDGVPFRKNYAGVGFKYDETLDAFIPAQMYPSWTLNIETCGWEPPVAEPTTEFPFIAVWNEDALNWDIVDMTIQTR